MDTVTQTHTEVPALNSAEVAGGKVGDGAGHPPVPIGYTTESTVLRYRNPEVTEGNLLVAIGSALAVVGFVDIAMLWYPLQLGTAGWEFAAASRTFTSAPMTMVGLVLAAVGLVRRGARPAVIRRAALLFVALSFVLVAMGLLYALSSLAVLAQASGEEATSALKRAIVKNGVEIVAYPITLLAIAAILWQGIREDRCD